MVESKLILDKTEKVWYTPFMNVNTCRSINKIILKNNDSNEQICYRLFCILKNIDTDNNGFIEYDKANKASTLLLNKNFTLKALSRIPNITKYMTINEKGVFLNSWKYIWEYFEVTPTVWVSIPYWVFQNTSTFKMYLYAGYVKDTIQTRSKIEKETGVPKSTQIRYERKLGIEKEHRVVEHSETTVTELLVTDTVSPNSIFEYNGKWYQQLSNQYFSNVKFESSRLLREYNGSRHQGHQTIRRNTVIHQPTNYNLTRKEVHTTNSGISIVPTNKTFGTARLCAAVNYGYELSK